MGVLDIFEPTRADFSPMTDIRGIYTRHVEQSVNVNIRTHANEHLNREISPSDPFQQVLNSLVHFRTIGVSQEPCGVIG